MFAWNKTPEVAVNLQIELSKPHFLLTEPITGNIFITCGDRIDIQKLSISVEGYYCTYEPLRNGSFQETKTKFYNTNKLTVAEIPKSVITLPVAETHAIQFLHPPLFISHLTPTCFLPDRIKIFWIVIAELTFPKRSAIQTCKEFALHIGTEMAHLNAPDTLVEAKQTFFTHSPIHYTVSVPRSVYAAGETVPISLRVQNLSKMSVIKMKFDLHQKWECSRRSDLFSLYRVEVVSPPIFPILSNEEKTQVIQFPLPPRLAPTLAKRIHKQAPLTLSYKIDMEFTTSKSDVFVVSLPIAIEDNYPPRAISSATQTFNSLNQFSQIQPNSYASMRAPQAISSQQFPHGSVYQSQQPQFQAVPPQGQQQIQYQPVQQAPQQIQYQPAPSQVYSVASQQTVNRPQQVQLAASPYQSRFAPQTPPQVRNPSPVVQHVPSQQHCAPNQQVISSSPVGQVPAVFSQAPSFVTQPQVQQNSPQMAANQYSNSQAYSSPNISNAQPVTPLLPPASPNRSEPISSEAKEIAPPQYSIPFVPMTQPAAMSDLYPELVSTPPQFM